MLTALGAAGRVLAVGIGGGGDVVGALAVAELCRALGTPASVGGLTWERGPVDPRPGPRRIAELRGATALGEHAALAHPGTTGPGGFRFAESRMAEHLGEPVALLDPGGGPGGVAAGLQAAARELRCELVVLVDVGGDVLAHGDEPGLGSPLADAVCLAAAPLLEQRSGIAVLGALFGAGCDGELTPAEVAARLRELAAGGGLLGAWGPGSAELERLEAAAGVIPTEASAMALRCARGETGEAAIRGGRRTVRLTPAGGLAYFFDPAAALAGPARCARLVAAAGSLEQADALLRSHGIATELGWERARAPRSAAGETEPSGEPGPGGAPGG